MPRQVMPREVLKRLLITGLLALSASALAVGAPAGSTISNQGFMDYSTDDPAVQNQTAPSNIVNISVQQVYGVNVSPDGTSSAPGQTYTTDPGLSGVLKYVLTNTGNGSDSFNLTTFGQSGNVTPANVRYYNDTNSNGAYDSGTDTQITGAITLAAATTATDLTGTGTKTFFAVYPTAANAAAGTTYDIDPQAQSTGSGAAVDNNNYGRIAVNSIYDLTLAASNTGTVNVSATRTYTETLTNTGNIGVTAAQLALSATVTNADKTGAALAAGAFTTTYTATYGATTSASFSTPQAAIAGALGAGTLAANGAITLTVSVAAPAGRLDGDKSTAVLTALVNVTATSTVKNNDATGNTGNTITDVTTVTRGIAAFAKTQALCGTSGATSPANCPNYAVGAGADVSAKPGDYVVYYLRAQNTGGGNLYNVKLRDPLPADTLIYSVGAKLTGVSGTVKYSTDGTTWVADPTTLSALTGGTTTLYVAVENSSPANTTIDGTDSIPGGGEVLVRIKVKVRDTAATSATPVADGQTVQ